MPFEKVASIIKSYSSNRLRFGDISIYKKAVELLGDFKQADEFMLSNYGGYDTVSLDRIKARIMYEKSRAR